MTEQSPASERLSSLREQAARLVAEIDQHREECADLLDDSEPATEPARPHGKLWQLLDWSFWGAGMGDVFRMPLADTMLAAVPVETIEQAEEIMAEFIERRKIEKTGVTVYQEQRDELEQLRARVAELEARDTPTWRDRAETAEARVAALEDQRERRRVRLAKAEADLLEMRGLLSPNGHPRRIPDEVEIHERVAPAVEWLLNRVAELEADLKRYVGHEPTIAEELAYLSRCLDAVHDECDRAEHAATRWEHPLPVPEWVAPVQAAADGQRKADPNRPALPWAHAMPDDDLHGFLNDLLSAAADRWRSDPEVPDRDVLTNVEKVCAAWRTPGQGYRSDEPSAEAGEGQ